jgi:hypothetical protein
MADNGEKANEGGEDTLSSRGAERRLIVRAFVTSDSKSDETTVVHRKKGFRSEEGLNGQFM